MPQRIQTGNADGVGATPLNIEMKPKKNSLRGDGVGATPIRARDAAKNATFWASALDFCVTAKNWKSESVAR